MPARKLRPEDQIYASKIQSLAFVFERDFSAAEKDPEQFQKGYEVMRGFFDENDKLSSCLSLVPYEVRFDNHTVKMGGIGGVSSLPEERNKGNVRKLLRFCFEEMHENQQIFSYLYPFSNPYYRQFGYESCFRRAMISVPLTSFKHFKASGSAVQYQPSQDYEPIRSLYNDFIADKNLAMVRNDWQWDSLIKKDPYKTRQYTYIWHDAQDKPGSYVIFKPEGGWLEFDMQVIELIWSDYESLAGILGFLSRFSPKYKTFKCPASEFLNMHIMVPEPNDVKLELAPSGMNRIVDLQKVLELMAYPEGKGQVAISVKDTFLEWNDGTFVINWGPDGVDVVKKACPADMTCSIEVLTQLITGYTRPDDYFGRSDLQIHSQGPLLASLFMKKRLYMNDHF